MNWDIFCKVVDNFGDAGVCWRLARQLADEQGFSVSLWLDQPLTLSPLLPGFEPEKDIQEISGVRICRWEKETPPKFDDRTDVVIEAFACELPENYLAGMAQSGRFSSASPPRWINLEYLGTEAWVEGCHGLPSPHPRLPLMKYFFFPGFTPGTGGLLREKDLFSKRRAFLEHGGDKKLLDAFNPSKEAACAGSEIRVSLFCYDTAPLAALLNAWQQEPAPLLCLVPQGKPLKAVTALLGSPPPWFLGDARQIRIMPIPFLPQTVYDELLWSCDLNFVRGEDSFIRAQWAGKPFVWNILPQKGNASQNKLEAFLKLYAADLPDELRVLLETFWHSWNGDGALLAQCWPAFLARLPDFKTHVKNWSCQLAGQEPLAANLARFCKDKL